MLGRLNSALYDNTEAEADAYSRARQGVQAFLGLKSLGIVVAAIFILQAAYLLGLVLSQCSRGLV
jgi:hypothetical protein